VGNPHSDAVRYRGRGINSRQCARSSWVPPGNRPGAGKLGLLLTRRYRSRSEALGIVPVPGRLQEAKERGPHRVPAGCESHHGLLQYMILPLVHVMVQPSMPPLPHPESPEQLLTCQQPIPALTGVVALVRRSAWQVREQAHKGSVLSSSQPFPPIFTGKRPPRQPETDVVRPHASNPQPSRQPRLDPNSAPHWHGLTRAERLSHPILVAAYSTIAVSSYLLVLLAIV
jgi:hypothetical protein